MNNIAILVPLKRFDVAKDRLRQGGTRDVTELAQDLAREVVRSCAPRHVIVLSESDEVSEFARTQNAEVFESDARSQNEAVQLAYEKLGDQFDQLIVVHGDLRNPGGLGNFAPGDGVTIVTDHHQSGTNVLALPTRTDFHFAYGANSKDQHRDEALRLGLECRIIVASPWAFDVDEPGDLSTA
jgi:2-phospho-L-lactate guanylyltransferase